jgi:GWxTD domain-containing protein
MRRLLPALALLFAILPAAADAQSADTTFRAFYQDLPRLTDARLKAVSEGRDQLRAGFAALELTSRTNNQTHAFRAARLFAAIVNKQQDQPWAHFGLAKALVRSPRAITVVRAIGLPSETERARVVDVEVHTQLQLALKLDPTMEEARSMLAQFAEVPSAVVPPTPAFTDAALYFQTLDSADEVTLAKLIHDIAIIATPQEMLTVTQGDFDKRREAMTLFWKKRAVRDGISPEARVLEHYRRIHLARKRYGPPVPYYTVYGKKRVGLEAELDDRGLIYVRFGPPHNFDDVSEELTEKEKLRRGIQVWAYLQPDGRYHVYFFEGGRMISDPIAAMVNSPSPAAVAENEKLLSTLRKYDARYHMIAMRQENVRLHKFMTKANPAYARTAAAAEASATEDAMRQKERIVEKNRRMLFMAFDMDAARPRFPQPLTLFHDFATFRGRGCTDVVYSVAVPAPRYHLVLAIADTFTWDAQSIDTTVTGDVGAGDYLRATGVFCSTPDYNSYVRLTATADSTTGVTAGGELQIPDYSGTGLMMSDILVASTEPGSFVRGNARLSLVPPRQFREGESFRVFYELYNLPAGRAYRTEIKLTTTESNFFARLFKGRTTTTVTFEGIAEGRDVVQELRTLVPQVEAGEAELRVKVTDLQTGFATEKKKTMWIIPSAK